MKYKQYFIRFLKQHNAYEMFMDNFNSENGINYRYNINKDVVSAKIFFKTRSPANFLAFAFRFGETKEGHGFWKNINIDWHYYLSNLNPFFTYGK